MVKDDPGMDELRRIGLVTPEAELSIDQDWSSFQLHQFLTQRFPALFDYINRLHPELRILRGADDFQSDPWESIQLPYILLRKKRRMYSEIKETHPDARSVLATWEDDTQPPKRKPAMKDKSVHLRAFPLEY